MEKIGKWCFCANNFIDWSAKTNNKIVFIMFKKDDKYYGYSMEEFGDYLNFKIELMNLRSFETIQPLQESEIQKLISFGNVQSIQKEDESNIIFNNYWSLFYSPSSYKFKLALRYSFSPRDVENNIIWTEGYIIEEYLSSMVNDSFKSINRQHKYLDKRSYESFQQDLSIEQFKKLIQIFEDEEFTFNLLKKKTLSSLSVYELSNVKVKQEPISINVHDIEIYELIKELEDLQVRYPGYSQIIKYHSNGVPILFFRKKSKDIFEFRDVFTNKISEFTIEKIKDILK